MLRPEGMYNFKIVTYEEDKNALVKTIMEFGMVHLRETETYARLMELPLISAILEGVIDLEEVDLDYLIEYVKDLVGEDEVYANLTASINELKEITLAKEIARFVENEGLPLTWLIETDERPVLSRVYAVETDADLKRLTDKLIEVGALVKSGKLASGKTIILVTFSRRTKERVFGIARESKLKEITLPTQILKEGLDGLKRREKEVKDKIKGVLSEVLDRVSTPFREEVETRLRNLRELVEKNSEVYKTIDKVERVLDRVLILKVANEVISKDSSLVNRLKLPKKVVRLVKEVLREVYPLSTTSYASVRAKVVPLVEEYNALMRYIKEVKLPKEDLEHILSHINKLRKAILALLLEEHVYCDGVSDEILSKLSLLEVTKTLRAIKAKKVKVSVYLHEELEARLKEISSTINELSSEVNEVLEKLEDLESIILKDCATEVMSEAVKISQEFANVCASFVSLELGIESLSQLYSSTYCLKILHKRGFFIVDGWIPASYVNLFKDFVKARLPKALYVNIREATPEDEVPIILRPKGFFKYLTMLTLSRDTPSYWELDPTMFFSILFITMYGFMFGDIGLGAIIALFGAWLFKTKVGLLGMDEKSAESLGMLALACGISSIIFGGLYGIAFLAKVWHPIFISPIHDLMEIIKVALIFGMIQLILAMSINVVNNIITKDYIKAILGGTGVVGIIYYLVGAYLASNIVASGYNIRVLGQPHNLMAAGVVLIMMVLAMLSGVIEAKKTGHKEEMMHSVIELIEMIVAYPANTLSYIRLAAFAIAHEVFGLLAETMSHMIGVVPSFIFANFIVLAIEGFAVGIQAMRLIYYEFSTKFLRGGGIKFRPLILKM